MAIECFNMRKPLIVDITLTLSGKTFPKFKHRPIKTVFMCSSIQPFVANLNLILLRIITTGFYDEQTDLFCKAKLFSEKTRFSLIMLFMLGATSMGIAVEQVVALVENSSVQSLLCNHSLSVLCLTVVL